MNTGATIGTNIYTIHPSTLDLIKQIPWNSYIPAITNILLTSYYCYHIIKLFQLDQSGLSELVPHLDGLNTVHPPFPPSSSTFSPSTSFCHQIIPASLPLLLPFSLTFAPFLFLSFPPFLFLPLPPFLPYPFSLLPYPFSSPFLFLSFSLSPPSSLSPLLSPLSPFLHSSFVISLLFACIGTSSR